MSGKNNFLNIVKDLEKEEENKGYLILVRCGAFFIERLPISCNKLCEHYVKFKK